MGRKIPLRYSKRKYLRFIKIILAVEMFIMAFAVCDIFALSNNHTFEKYSKIAITTIANFDNKKVVKISKKPVKKTWDEFVTETDEEVWAATTANYRKGPGEDYKKLGEVSAFTKLQRTGTTNNGWSRVKIDDKDCFVFSEYITTEPPAAMASGQKGEYQQYALSLLGDFGWSESEITPLINLWNRESGWNPNSHNKYSGAHGIPQALPASKMASEGDDYYTNGKTQIRWGLKYIKNRYGSPSNAWAHFRSHNWY